MCAKYVECNVRVLEWQLVVRADDTVLMLSGHNVQFHLMYGSLTVSMSETIPIMLDYLWISALNSKELNSRLVGCIAVYFSCFLESLESSRMVFEHLVYLFRCFSRPDSPLREPRRRFKSSSQLQGSYSAESPRASRLLLLHVPDCLDATCFDTVSMLSASLTLIHLSSNEVSEQAPLGLSPLRELSSVMR
jgi:hypothetical protein